MIHTELKVLLEAQQQKKAPVVRKMITCDEKTHDKLAAIAAELGAPISKTVGVLVSYYLEEDVE